MRVTFFDMLEYLILRGNLIHRLFNVAGTIMRMYTDSFRRYKEVLELQGYGSPMSLIGSTEELYMIEGFESTEEFMELGTTEGAMVVTGAVGATSVVGATGVGEVLSDIIGTTIEEKAV